MHATWGILSAHYVLEMESHRIRAENIQRKQPSSSPFLKVVLTHRESPGPHPYRMEYGPALSFPCIPELGLLSEAKETDWS